MNPSLTRTILVMAAFGSLSQNLPASFFGDDVAFLQKHTEIIVLKDKKGQAEVAVSPAWQGRVMTSTAAGDDGRSFGFINRELIESGKLLPHMNAFGGEDRFWLGPEGGQFSIYFAKGAEFNLANWQVPAPFDTLPFRIAAKSRAKASFTSEFSLTNYSGTRFEVAVKRDVRLLDSAAAWKKLKTPAAKGVNIVAYESDNHITNIGKNAWDKESGLLSVWILGMFTPSPTATIVVPIKSGPEFEMGVKVTSDYFGAIPPERLKVEENAVFLSGDGKFRSKIGINPKRSKAVIGAYDAENQVLTIVQFDQPEGVLDYVNSLWKLQDKPFGGDAINSYNDGPPSPGAKPLGPFFEIESSSPAAALAPGNGLSHLHRTIHLTGPEEALDPVAQKILGVSLAQIKGTFHSN